MAKANAFVKRCFSGWRLVSASIGLIVGSWLLLIIMSYAGFLMVKLVIRAFISE